MNRTSRLATFAFGAVLASAAAFAQEVPPPRFVTPPAELKIQAVSRIQSVTVFADRATVVRTTQIRPVLGPQSVVFSGLPKSIMSGSLRASGRGAAEVKILGLESANEFLEAPLLPGLAKLQAELDGVSNEIARIKNDQAVLAAQESLLLTLPGSQAAVALSLDVAAATRAPIVADAVGAAATARAAAGAVVTVVRLAAAPAGRRALVAAADPL